MADNNKSIAQLFGTSLDQDDYETTQKLLSENCEYDFGQGILHGPKEITNSYEQNMIAGRAKMDKLEWGTSTVDKISENEFVVNFTDYLFHKGEKYIHRCQQKLHINSSGKIERIIHINNAEESKRLKAWYTSVDIPTS